MERLESGVNIVTVAMLSISQFAGAGIKWFGIITIEIECVVLLAILSKLQLSVFVPLSYTHEPIGVVTEIKVNASPVKISVKFTSTAVDGPLLRTWIVYVASVPASTGLGVTVLLTNSISAIGSTVTLALSILLVLFVSPVSRE